MTKVVVGMSGGVDSAVTAYLLKKQGYEVIGVTLRTEMSSLCCEIDEARKASREIGIRYYPSNCITEFEERIICPFVDGYIHGNTPNPCVFCNRLIKWEFLLHQADIMGSSYIATGHYAAVVKKSNGRYTVKKALHTDKDQTYMLYRLSQAQLQRTLMPLASLSKAEVREIAKQASLSVSSKKDSQEICFVTNGKHGDFIEEFTGKSFAPGDFVNENGEVLGKHKGLIRYTVGQRKKLGLALGYPAYVKEIRAGENQIVIAGKEALDTNEIFCSDLNYMSISEPEPGDTIDCFVKIRYRGTGYKAKVYIESKDLVRIVFASPVTAPSTGQSAVFYDEEDCVIGGGIITGAGFVREPGVSAIL